MANLGGLVVWLTGLPCAGKSTIASGLAAELSARGRRVEILDGDALRPVLSQELGFSRTHRDMNVRRIGFVASLLARNGVATIVAVVSPFRALRDELRASIGRAFVEVYVECPVQVCEQRDVKGMYAKARAGLLANFTGVDDPYEPPEAADVHLCTDREAIGDSVQRILLHLDGRGYLAAVREPPARARRREAPTRAQRRL
jgi:adenylylsulfate kinase